MQGAHVPFLVGELRSQLPHSAAKKVNQYFKKKKTSVKKENYTSHKINWTQWNMKCQMYSTNQAYYSKEGAPNRNVMRVTSIILNFLVASFKKRETGEIDFNHLFYLTQYVPKILSS